MTAPALRQRTVTATATATARGANGYGENAWPTLRCEGEKLGPALDSEHVFCYNLDYRLRLKWRSPEGVGTPTRPLAHRHERETFTS